MQANEYRCIYLLYVWNQSIFFFFIHYIDEDKDWQEPVKKQKTQKKEKEKLGEREGWRVGGNINTLNLWMLENSLTGSFASVLVTLLATAAAFTIW